jgi:hypothetical protein
MPFAFGSSNAAGGMRSQLRAMDRTLDKWSIDEIAFSPPSGVQPLRSSPLTSTFTSHDLDYNAYVIQYLVRRLDTSAVDSWKTRRFRRQLRGLRASLDRVAKRHGELIQWDAV